MKPQSDIASYVSDLRRRLHLPPEVQERIVAEAEAHLQDRTTAHVAQGMDRTEAERLAVAEFGPVWRVALRFRLAYPRPMIVLGWVVTMSLLAIDLHGAYHQAVSYPRIVPWSTPFQRLAILMVLALVEGIGLRLVFPRRLVLAACLTGVSGILFSVFINAYPPHLPSGWEVVHVWNGWHSGFVFRQTTAHPSHPARVFMLERDVDTLWGWFRTVVWWLNGVWVSRSFLTIGEIRRREAA